MLPSILLLLLTFPTSIQSAKGYDYGIDRYKDTCGFFGPDEAKACNIREGLKSMWRIMSYTWSPEKTKNMTLTELKSHCDDLFVCLENSGCYKDFVNYQKLDKCIDDSFQVGPMWYCDHTLREVLKTSPGNLTDCVKEKLNDNNPEKVDCLSIQQTGECYLPDVEKHCEPSFLKVFKEHLELRLYNRACGGRLRYKDWDYVGGKDVAMAFVPGGVKVSDPKRDQVNGTDNNNN